MAKRGIVYCIANDTMPGLVKIGATLLAWVGSTQARKTRRTG